MLPIPDDQRPGTGQVPESFEGPLGLAVLVDGDSHDHKNETQEHQGFFQVSQGQVDDPAGHQEEKHGFPGHFQRNRQDSPLPRGREFVVPFRLQAPGCFRLGKAADGVKVEVFHRSSKGLKSNGRKEMV